MVDPSLMYNLRFWVLAEVVEDTVSISQISRSPSRIPFLPKMIKMMMIMKNVKTLIKELETIMAMDVQNNH